MALIQGKAFYAKVLGKPQPGYDKEKNEWSFDLSLDEKGKAEAKRLGFTEKIKNKGDDRGDFIQFKRGEFKNTKPGEPAVANTPFSVVDQHGKPWDSKKLIGNGSTLNVKYSIYAGRKGNKPIALAIQVWDHVPYTAGGFPTKKLETAQAEDEADFTTASEDE